MPRVTRGRTVTTTAGVVACLLLAPAAASAADTALARSASDQVTVSNLAQDSGGIGQAPGGTGEDGGVPWGLFGLFGLLGLAGAPKPRRRRVLSDPFAAYPVMRRAVPEHDRGSPASAPVAPAVASIPGVEPVARPDQPLAPGSVIPAPRAGHEWFGGSTSPKDDPAAVGVAVGRTRSGPTTEPESAPAPSSATPPHGASSSVTAALITPAELTGATPAVELSPDIPSPDTPDLAAPYPESYGTATSVAPDGSIRLAPAPPLHARRLTPPRGHPEAEPRWPEQEYY